MKTSASPCLFPVQLSFSGVCSLPRQERSVFILCARQKWLQWKILALEKKTHTLLYISIAFSALQNWELESIMFAMHFLFFLLTRVCDLYHKAAYFVLKLEWVNLLMSLSLSLRLLVYRGIYPTLLSFWLWRWNWSKGGWPLSCWESTFIPNQANIVVVLKVYPKLFEDCLLHQWFEEQVDQSGC